MAARPGGTWEWDMMSDRDGRNHIGGDAKNWKEQDVDFWPTKPSAAWHEALAAVQRTRKTWSPGPHRDEQPPQPDHEVSACGFAPDAAFGLPARSAHRGKARLCQHRALM